MLTKDKQSLFSKSSSAFTIIELVIVIVIIGILTAIGIIAYQGLTKRAKETAIKSDLTNARKQLELHKAEYGVYPTTNDCEQEVSETNICLKASSGHELGYTPEDNDQGYIIGVTADDGYHTIDGQGNIVKLTGWKEIMASYDYTCGLAVNNKVYCWGKQLGSGVLKPTPINTSIKFKQLTTGLGHTCGIAIDGQAYCWGENSYGELGDETTVNKQTPTLVGTTVKFKQLTAGRNHTCGIAIDDKAYCWGSNSRGQLGAETDTSKQTTPILVETTIKFKQLTAGGGNHTCGLAITGQAYCWGGNSYGELGDETTVNKQTPTLVVGDFIFQQLVVAQLHTCALTINNKAYCWGSNAFGELGIGSGDKKNRPTPVEGGRSFKYITAQYSHTCAIASDNQAYCWGMGNYGQLGNNKTSGYYILPGLVNRKQTQMPIEVFIQQLTTGNNHTCALGTTGQAYCWGANNYGQLGNGGTSEKNPLPLLVAPPF